MRYDQTSIENAVRAVEARMSVRNAAKQFNVLRSTIGDCKSGKHDLNTSHGRPPALPAAVEAKIVGSIKAAA
jgi:hypothetical protein